MKSFLFPALLFFYSVAVAQQAPYQAFEVDSAAIPRGGMAYLTTFVQANLRKPIAAEAEGIGGLVVVGGTVEADGRIANVNVMRGLRPDCDREAVRVFSLFNAWKPARKGGKAVQQLVSFPIKFTPNAPYLYRNGAHNTFYDKSQKPIPDSSLAFYKQVTPLDSIGLPDGDVVVYEKKQKQWKEISRAPFIRKDDTPSGAFKRVKYTLGYPSSIYRYDGQLAVVDASGRLIHRAYFQNGKRMGSEFRYYPNGATAEQIQEVDKQTNYTYWYPNGQIKELKTISVTDPLNANRTEQVFAYWDSTGNRTIQNGTGHVVFQSDEQSKIDTLQYVKFVEQGDYKNGLKQGNWTGRYSDDSYFYKEQYEQGVCQSGEAKSAGGDTLRYTMVEKMPEFQGGMPGLGQFLAQNLRYPANAQRSGIQGRVFVSFVVCTDGSLCDYKIIRGAHPELDEEAIRVVQKSSGYWKPGVQRGQKVKVKYNLPVNFSLQ